MSINESGAWIIDQIKSEAATQGRPLTDEDIQLLQTPIPEMMAGASRDYLRALNNRVVELARSAMERQKAAGVPTTRARRGLRIPSDWNLHYQRIFTGNLSWVISGVMQNAMMANPFADEARPWKSR